MNSGRPTLNEVATRAGVGRGTVSRVVNGSPQVSPEARAAVEAAIVELGYIPNRVARALVTNRTDSIALVVAESEDRVFAQPFFAGIVRGISSELIDTPLQLWLAMAQSPIARDRLEHHLTSQHVDGVLLTSLHEPDPLLRLLRERGLPVVVGGRPGGHAVASPHVGSVDDVSYVDIDNVGGARAAVQHLLDTGRRKVATIAGLQDMGVGVDRLTGYRQAMGDRPSLVAFGDWGEASGAAAMRELLLHTPEVDGVFVASDLMAAGAMRTLRELGRRVPEEVALVGFEDAPIAAQLDPPLTTVFQPVEEQGRQMVRLLIARIAGDPEPSHVLLPTELVHRAST